MPCNGMVRTRLMGGVTMGEAHRQEPHKGCKSTAVMVCTSMHDVPYSSRVCSHHTMSDLQCIGCLQLKASNRLGQYLDSAN